MWEKIKKLVSDSLIGIMLFPIIVEIIMIMTAQSLVIFILGAVLLVGTIILPFANDKILKISRKKEIQTKKATTSSYLFWKKIELSLDVFTDSGFLYIFIIFNSCVAMGLMCEKTPFMFVCGILFLTLAIVIPIGAVDLWKFVSRKVRKMEEEQKQGITNPSVEEEKEYNTESMNNQKVEEIICEIDQKLKEGYAFKTISIDKWKNGYRNEIVNLCSCKYELDSDTEKRILSILQILKNDLIDQYYAKYEIKKEATVSALEKLADMDGLTELTLNIRK